MTEIDQIEKLRAALFERVRANSNAKGLAMLHGVILINRFAYEEAVESTSRACTSNELYHLSRTSASPRSPGKFPDSPQSARFEVLCFRRLALGFLAVFKSVLLFSHVTNTSTVAKIIKIAAMPKATAIACFV